MSEPHPAYIMRSKSKSFFVVLALKISLFYLDFFLFGMIAQFSLCIQHLIDFYTLILFILIYVLRCDGF